MIRGLDTTFLVEADVQGHPQHTAARELMAALLDAGDSFALAPQVLTEFIQVVTDSRRFSEPLTMAAAIERAEAWWGAAEIAPVFPSESTVPVFCGWLAEHGLGRRRLLDTMLAATYWSAGVRSIVTSNAGDFSLFDCFEIIRPGEWA